MSVVDGTATARARCPGRRPPLPLGWGWWVESGCVRGVSSPVGWCVTLANIQHYRWRSRTGGRWDSRRLVVGGGVCAAQPLLRVRFSAGLAVVADRRGVADMAAARAGAVRGVRLGPCVSGSCGTVGIPTLGGGEGRFVVLRRASRSGWLFRLRRVPALRLFRVRLCGVLARCPGRCAGPRWVVRASCGRRRRCLRLILRGRRRCSSGVGRLLAAWVRR